MSALTTLSVLPASAVDRGDATVVRPINDTSGPGETLTSGTASTPFSLQLPSGAACTKSSADAGYRVQSFMVPSATDVTTLSFAAEKTLPLFTVAGDPYVDAQTAQGQKNEPGYVVNVPAFDLALLGDKDAPAGDYLVGLACTKGDDLDRVWSTAITVAADRSWTVPTTNASAAASSSSAGSDAVAATSGDVVGSTSVAASTNDSSPDRNALPETPGGMPTVNVSRVRVPPVFVIAVLLVAMRIAFLFRPRPRVMEI